MIKTVCAEILCTGNELLIGRTINKNASDIALALTRIGINVERVTTVRDDLSTIIEVIKEILQRNIQILVITGGLGPTHDDIQLEAVSKALDLPLLLDPVAASLICERYEIKFEEMGKSKTKMATIPSGGIALRNRVGSAPGVKIKYQNTLIYCLPGVPKEMNSILDEEIITDLKNIFPSQGFVEFGFDIYKIGESKIIPITEKIMKQYPQVNFKSHPKRDEKGYWLSLHTYGSGPNSELVKEACIAWYNEIKSHFELEMSEIKSLFDDGFNPELS